MAWKRSSVRSRPGPPNPSLTHSYSSVVFDPGSGVPYQWARNETLVARNALREVLMRLLRWFCILFVIVPFALYAQHQNGASNSGSSSGSGSSSSSPSSSSSSGSYSGGGGGSYSGSSSHGSGGGGGSYSGSSGGGGSHSGGGGGGSYSGGGSSGGSHSGGGSYSGGSSGSPSVHHGGGSSGSYSGGSSSTSGSHSNSGSPSNNHRNSGLGNATTEPGSAGSRQHGGLNSGARISSERFSVPEIGRGNSQPGPTAPAASVWNGVHTSSHHETSGRQSQLDSYRPKQDWLVGSHQPVDRHTLSKYFSRQEHLDDREAKLNKEAAQLKAERLKSGARISKLDFKEQKLAAKRAKLESDRKKATETLADANKRKPCKQKNCVQCPGGVMGKNGCVYPTQQDANLYRCHNGYQEVPCGLYSQYRGNQCDSERSALAGEENYIAMLVQKIEATCSADGNAPDCIMLRNELEQARLRKRRLEQKYRLCMMSN